MPRRFLLVLLLLLHAVTVRAVTTLDLAFDAGDGGDAWIEALVERFNREQREVDVRLVPRAASGRQAPLTLLDRAQAIAAGGEKVFRPLHQVVAETSPKADLRVLVPEHASVVADARGRLLALPIAQWTPILFYDKQAFSKAGLDPERPPASWFDVQQAAGKLFDAGSKCPFTQSRPSQNMLEQTSLWHGESVFAAGQRPVFNGLLQVKHLALMASWEKSRYFIPLGRGNEADAHFADGKCGMLVSGSYLYPVFRRAGIDVGVARLPVHEGYFGAPKHTVAEGRALWVGQGRSKAEYRAAASFVRFLMHADTQLELMRSGGFLPFAAAGKAALGSELITTESPQNAVGAAQINGARGGVQLSGMPWARQVINEELEAVWANRKPAKAALDAAVARISNPTLSKIDAGLARP